MLSPKKTGDLARASLLLAALTLGPQATYAAQTDFTAEVDRTEVAVGDQLRMTVTLSTSGGNAELRSFPESTAFRLASRSQSQSSSFSFGTGGAQSRRSTIFTLVYVAERTGTFTFTPGKAVSEGRSIETNEVRVKVVPAGTAPTPAPGRPAPRTPGFPDEFDPSGGGRRANEGDVFLRAQLDKPQVFLGEQTTLSLYLFTRVEVSGLDNLAMPKLDDFWVEEITTPTQAPAERRVVDGVAYNVLLIKRRALFPLVAGKRTIDKAEVDVNTGFGLLFRGERVRRASLPLTLDVLPLPAGAPAGFEAPNVGTFELSASLTPQRVRVGEPATLKVALKGVGALRNISLQPLVVPPGLKVYDPTLTFTPSSEDGQLGGTKLAEYLVMPERAGDFDLQPIVFVWFDPATRAYRDASSPPFRLHVEGAAAAGVTAPRQIQRLAPGDFEPIRLKGSLATASPLPWRNPWFALLTALPLLAWAGLALRGTLKRRLAPSDAALERRARAETKHQLKKAEAAFADAPDAAYAQARRATLAYFESRVKAPLGGLTRMELADRLATRGLPRAEIDRLAELLDLCDMGRFAPGGASRDTFHHLGEDAKRLVDAASAIPLEKGGQP